MVADHVQESIDSVVELRAKMDREVAAHQLGIEWFTQRLGRPTAVFVSLGCIAIWIAVNGVLQISGRHAFDPFPFVDLQSLITLAAFTMTILILTTTTRLGDVADRRARLALQIGILTEQKVAKTIELLESMRRDDPHLVERVDPVAKAMADPVDTAVITEALDESHRAIDGGPAQ